MGWGRCQRVPCGVTKTPVVQCLPFRRPVPGRPRQKNSRRPAVIQLGFMWWKVLWEHAVAAVQRHVWGGSVRPYNGSRHAPHRLAICTLPLSSYAAQVCLRPAERHTGVRLACLASVQFKCPKSQYRRSHRRVLRCWIEGGRSIVLEMAKWRHEPRACSAEPGKADCSTNRDARYIARLVPSERCCPSRRRATMTMEGGYKMLHVEGAGNIRRHMPAC